MADFREFQKQYNNYLMHHGILGMHWGIRRYQNPDGSLTPEGLVRYSYNKNTDSYEKRDKKTQKRIRDVVQKHPEWYSNPNDEEKNRIKNARSNKKLEEQELLKEGFEKNSYNDDDSVEKFDKNGNGSRLVVDNDGSYKKSKAVYEEFMTNKSKHRKQIIESILKNINRYGTWEDLDKTAVIKYVNSNKCKDFYEFLPDGTISGFIANIGGIPEFGYHSLEFEYDPKTKMLINCGLAG